MSGRAGAVLEATAPGWTAGPWTAERTSDGCDEGSYIKTAAGRIIALTLPRAVGEDAEDAPNARIMALAPELVAALVDLLSGWAPDLDLPFLVKARALVARARDGVA